MYVIKLFITSKNILPISSLSMRKLNFYFLGIYLKNSFSENIMWYKISFPCVSIIHKVYFNKFCLSERQEDRQFSHLLVHLPPNASVFDIRPRSKVEVKVNMLQVSHLGGRNPASGAMSLASHDWHWQKAAVRSQGRESYSDPSWWHTGILTAWPSTYFQEMHCKWHFNILMIFTLIRERNNNASLSFFVG